MAEVYGEDVLDSLGAATIASMRVLYLDHETVLPMRFRVLPRQQLDSFLLEQAAIFGTRIAERTSIAAIALADDLTGGARYENTMAPRVAVLQKAAGNVASASLLLGLAALKAGK